MEYSNIVLKDKLESVSEVFAHRHETHHILISIIAKSPYVETTLAWYRCLCGCDIFGYLILITIQFYDGPYQKKYLYGTAIYYHCLVILHAIYPPHPHPRAAYMRRWIGQH